MSGRADIRMYVEHLFEGRTLDSDTIELKEEIYGNLVARYDDYVAQGMPAEEAYRRTCEAVTSVDDVMGAVERGVGAERDAEAEKSADAGRGVGSAAGAGAGADKSAGADKNTGADAGTEPTRAMPRGSGDASGRGSGQEAPRADGAPPVPMGVSAGGATSGGSGSAGGTSGGSGSGASGTSATGSAASADSGANGASGTTRRPRRWSTGAVVGIVAVAVVAVVAVIAALVGLNVVDTGGRYDSQTEVTVQQVDETPTAPTTQDDGGSASTATPDAGQTTGTTTQTRGDLSDQIEAVQPETLAAQTSLSVADPNLCTEGTDEHDRLTQLVGGLPLGDYFSGVSTRDGGGYLRLTYSYQTEHERDLIARDDDHVDRALVFNAAALMCTISDLDTLVIEEVEPHDGDWDGHVFERSAMESALGVTLDASQLTSDAWPALRETLMTLSVWDHIWDRAEIDD